MLQGDRSPFIADTTVHFGRTADRTAEVDMVVISLSNDVIKKFAGPKKEAPIQDKIPRKNQ